MLTLRGQTMPLAKAQRRREWTNNTHSSILPRFQSSTAFGYTFSTKEYLPDAKLYLYQYRAYDPIAGRWTQRDPIDYQDSINLYQFCRNNPVNKVDTVGTEATNVQGRVQILHSFYLEVSNFVAYTEKNGKYPSNQVTVGKCTPLHQGTTEQGRTLPPDVQETINQTEKDPRRINAAKDSMKTASAMALGLITPKQAADRDRNNEITAHKIWMEYIQKKIETLQQEVDNPQTDEQK